ncbi:MAG TPA: hypothetical protein VLF17_01095 [Candidatus Nitrosotenuis sp.]|nr:hypothetical protein [Candidatus Nitrosotenuis sp.]
MNQDSQHNYRQIAKSHSSVKDDCLADYDAVSNTESWAGSAKFEHLQKPTVVIVKEILAIYEKNKPSSTQGILDSIFETYDRLIEEHQKYRTVSVS